MTYILDRHAVDENRFKETKPKGHRNIRLFLIPEVHFAVFGHLNALGGKLKIIFLIKL